MNLDLIVVGVVVLMVCGCWRLLQLEVKERKFQQAREVAVLQAQQHMQQEAHKAEKPHEVFSELSHTLENGLLC